MADAIGYLRFSTPKQEHGDSRERQLRDIRSHCDRKGWNLIEMVEDLGRSAYKGDHLRSGNLGTLTRRIMAGEFKPGTILVVEELDRLSRQGYRETQRWLDDVFERGLLVAVVKGDALYDRIAIDSDVWRAVEILMKAQVAHDQSVSKGGRVAKAWGEKFADTKFGKVLTRGCPGWLEAVGPGLGDNGTSFRIVGDRAGKVQQVYDWAASGVGLPEITRRLNLTGQAWGRSGGGFSITQVRRWLTTASVEGDFIPYEANPAKPNGERVVGYYPRIVDAALVDRARAGLMSRRKSGGARYKNTYPNLFMGLFRCACCLGKVVITRSQGPGYLRCQTAALGRGCTNKRLFRYREFETAAIREILHLALDDRFFQKGPDLAKATSELAEAQKLVRDLDEQMGRLTALLTRVEDPSGLVEKYDELNRERAAARERSASADEALMRARGNVTGAEHLQRVMSVSAAIQSEDRDVRLEARQKVHEALKAIVTMVACEPEDMTRGHPERTFTIILAGGLVNLMIDNRGNVIGKTDLVAQVEDDPQMRSGLLSGAGPAGMQIDAVARRAKAS